MKSKLLAIALLICIPGMSLAQVESCPDCVIGVFDSLDLSANYGTYTPLTQKVFYLGIKFAPPYDGATTIEFSLQGMPATGVPISYSVLNAGAFIGGSIETPPDTTNPQAQGGWNAYWTTCQSGNQALVSITLVSFDPIPDNTVIRVLRRFPPIQEGVESVLFTQCNLPLATITKVTGGCYVLNPTVQPGESVGDPPCKLVGSPVTKTTWSSIKELFR